MVLFFVCFFKLDTFCFWTGASCRVFVFVFFFGLGVRDVPGVLEGRGV